MTAHLFISQSDQEPGRLIESLISRAFPGEIAVFNAGRASSGLAAGDRIDTEIIEAIRGSDAVIWLASPHAVEYSFWMAWELGVASSLQIRVLPACCLGIRVVELPLLQSGRHAPDIGITEDLASFLVNIGDVVHQETTGVSKAVEHMLESNDGRNPFWGTKRLDTLDVRLLGHRLVVENQSDDNLAILTTSVDGVQGLPWSGADVLHARERRIVNLTNVSNGSLVNIGQTVTCEWIVSGKGRFYSTATIID